MRAIIDRFKRSSYLLQIVTLMSGTLIAQAIMLLFIPILTRLYTPSEFGLYSIFFAIASMVGMVSSLSYEQAIVLPKSNRDAEALLFLSIFISMLISLILGAVLAIFYDFFLEYFKGMDYMIWLLPIGTLTIGLIQIFEAYSVRREFYKKIASVKMGVAISTVSTQTISRYLFGLNGLIVGKVVSDILGLFLFAKYHIKEQTLHLKYLSKRRVLLNMKKYENFPKYQTASTLINSISQNVPLFLFTALFSPAVSGFYALTYRAMQTPMVLISSATRSVYYQKASKMYANGEDIFPIYRQTTLGLVKTFVLPFFAVLLYGQEMFSLVFGSEWVESGVIAQISIFWFGLVFISPPTTMMFNIYSLQKVRLMIQSVTLGLRVLSIYAGFYIYDSYIASVTLFVLVGIVQNVGIMFYIYLKIKEAS